MTPTQGSIVLLTIISGTERLQQNAFVLSSSPGLEGQPPLLNVAFLHPRRLDVLGSPDWRNAFDRRITVKHESHDDVQNSAEGCFWNEPDVVSTFATAEIEKLTDFLLDNHGRECNADTAVDIAIKLLAKSNDKQGDTPNPPDNSGELAKESISRLSEFIEEKFPDEFTASPVQSAIAIMERTPRRATPEEEAEFDRRAADANQNFGQGDPNAGKGTETPQTGDASASNAATTS